MTQIPVSTSHEQSIYAALELSKNSWLLAIQWGLSSNETVDQLRVPMGVILQ